MFLRNKFVNIHIVFVNSFASQLSFIFAQKIYAEENQNINNKRDLFIVFLYPSLSDPRASNSVLIKEFFNKSLGNQYSEILVIKLIKPFFRIFLSPLLFILKNFYRKSIFIWQPRYRSLEDSLVFHKKLFFSFKINFPIPKCDIVLFGDGFLNLMPVNRPFWLEQNKKENDLVRERLHKSYHLFCAGNNQLSLPSKELNPEQIRNFIKIYLEKCDHSLFEKLKIFFDMLDPNKNYKDFYIFPTTTFYETGRTTLNNEVLMYIKFLKESKIRRSDLILIKPHPSSSYEKNIAFYNKLKTDFFFKDFLIINPYSKKLKIDLNNIPLEIIIFYLYYYHPNQIIKKSIFLACASTASISAKILFPSIKIENAFGKKLIKDFLKNKYHDQRLKQEKILMDIVSKI